MNETKSEAIKLPSPLPYLAQVPDPRQPGKREHRWEALWLMALMAIACRCENILAIAQWVEDQDEWLLGKVKVRAVNGDGSLPKQASFYRFFWALEEQIETVEAQLYAWAKAVLKALGKDDETFRFSVDGKYLRGSSRSRKGERALVLLSAFVQELGLSLWQGKVATSEDDSAVSLISELEGLEGIRWLITGDAGLASAKVTNEVVAKKGATCW
jgi:hypothetical protein